MPNVKNTMIDKMLAVVAPHLCSGCGKTGTLLCGHCKYDISRDEYSGCVLCERPSFKGICDFHKMPYQQVWVVGERKDTLQRLIDGFKFQNIKAAAKDLAILLDEHLPVLTEDTLVIPIPTAPAHIRERGYDHALLVAQHFTDLRKLPLERKVLGRKSMASQKSANKKQRIEQSASAFTLIGTIDPRKHYLLVDDIITTGSTIESAARLLREAGAVSISVAVIARQPLD